MLCFSRLFERSSGAWLLLFGQVDLAKLLLILQDIIVEGHQKTLCVLGSHHYAATNLRLLHTGKHASEVEDKAQSWQRGVIASHLIVRRKICNICRINAL